MIRLSYHNEPLPEQSIQLPYSKSHLNRLLIMEAVKSSDLDTNRLNDDIKAMIQALECLEKNQPIAIKEAGTVLRFVLAKAANKPEFNNYLQPAGVLSSRPIEGLIELLQSLGADIEMQDTQIKVRGKKLKGGKLAIEEQLSSQFISALMMIGHNMEGDFQLKWSASQSSSSYIQMTAATMRDAGIELTVGHNEVNIHHHSEFAPKFPDIESDWSSASFFFALALIDASRQFELVELQTNSSQAELQLYLDLLEWGLLESIPSSLGIAFKAKKNFIPPGQIDFTNYPDAAINIMLCWAINGWSLKAIGMQTLDLKESKRLTLFVRLLKMINVEVDLLDAGCIQFDASDRVITDKLTLSCENDHRIAMAWALLATQSQVNLEGHTCVTKSFPYFWQEINKIGFTVDA